MKSFILLTAVTTVLMGCNSSSKIDGNQEQNTSSSSASSVANINQVQQSELNAYLPTLMFHYIKDVPANSADQIGYKLSFSPQSLEEFLQYFTENNIQTLTYIDIKELLDEQKPLPKKAVVLTFDDGHIDHYTSAFTLLQKYNMKAVFFIIAGKPGNDPAYATWPQIKEMADSGQEIGSHSMSHRDLATLSSNDLITEVVDSKKQIEEQIGKEVVSFCYPAGKYNNAVLSLVKQQYLFARTTKAGKQFAVQDRYELPTVRIFPTTGIASLEAWFDKE